MFESCFVPSSSAQKKMKACNPATLAGQFWPTDRIFDTPALDVTVLYISHCCFYLKHK